MADIKKGLGPDHIVNDVDMSDYATKTELTDGLKGKQDSGDYATNTALTNGLAGKANSSHGAHSGWVPSTGGTFTGSIASNSHVSASNGVYAYGGDNVYSFRSNGVAKWWSWGYWPDGYQGIFTYARNSPTRYFMSAPVGRSLSEATRQIQSPILMTQQSRLLNDKNELDEEPHVTIDQGKTIEHLAEIVEKQAQIIAALADSATFSVEDRAAVAELQALMSKETHEVLPDAEVVKDSKGDAP